jgi:hypothetical protein
MDCIHPMRIGIADRAQDAYELLQQAEQLIALGWLEWFEQLIA